MAETRRFWDQWKTVLPMLVTKARKAQEALEEIVPSDEQEEDHYKIVADFLYEITKKEK